MVRQDILAAAQALGAVCSTFPDEQNWTRRVEDVLRRIDQSATRGHLGIAHALAEAGHMPMDEYLRTHGGGEYVAPK